MQVARTWVALVTVIALGGGTTGCVKPAANAPKSPTADHGEHGHDHEHGHVHSGPHQGHLMVLGNEEYHAEWTHDENGKVTFYILDAAGKNEVPIAAEQITIDVKIGNNEPKTYELVAVDAKDGKSATFEVVDKQFAGLFDQLKSSGLVLTLNVDIGGKHFSQVVKEHDHEH